VLRRNVLYDKASVIKAGGDEKRASFLSTKKENILIFTYFAKE
jgi:hypothetical protein